MKNISLVIVRCVHCACLHVLAHMHKDAENHPYCSSTSFIRARSLNQAQSSLMWLVSLVSVLSSLPSEAGITGRLPQLLSIYIVLEIQTLILENYQKNFPSILPLKCFQTGSSCVVQAGLKLRILLPPLLECWDYRLAASCLARKFSFENCFFILFLKSHPVLRILHSNCTTFCIYKA